MTCLSLTKIHIGNFILAKIEFIKYIDSCFINYSVCPNISNFIINKVCIGIIMLYNFTGKSGKRLHNKPCRRYGRNNFLA